GVTLVTNQTTNDRVFQIPPTGVAINVTITGVTIQGGQVTRAGGGGIHLLSTSSLTLANDIVQKNSADVGGGIDAADGFVNIANSLIASNSSAGTMTGQGGGGLAIHGSRQVTNVGSEFTRHRQAGHGRRPPQPCQRNRANA